MVQQRPDRKFPYWFIDVGLERSLHERGPWRTAGDRKMGSD